MSSAVCDWQMTGVHCNESSALEQLIGVRLQAVWATILVEPLPSTLWTAIALLGERSDDAAEPLKLRLQVQAQSRSWCCGLGRMADWREHRERLSQRKMIQRAIRKQGNAWLVDEDPDYFS